jgi:glutathione S-transferase
MKLYMVPLAPNPTKVMLYIAERAALGLDMGIEQIVVNTVKGRHREPEHIARNPFGKLPVLELENATFITESLSIIQYLEDRFPKGALSTGDAFQKAKAAELERIVELLVAAPMGRYAHATNSPLGRPPNPEVAKEAADSLPMPLDYLEAQLADGRACLAGEAPSVADFTLQAFCQFLRFVELDVFGDRPALRAWDERYRARPAAKAVLKW